MFKRKCFSEYMRYKEACSPFTLDRDFYLDDDYINTLSIPGLEREIENYRQNYIDASRCIGGRDYVRTNCYERPDYGHDLAIHLTNKRSRTVQKAGGAKRQKCTKNGRYYPGCRRQSRTRNEIPGSSGYHRRNGIHSRY